MQSHVSDTNTGWTPRHAFDQKCRCYRDRHEHDTDPLTPVTIWEIDIIECNHACLCSANVGHIHISDMPLLEGVGTTK